MTTWDLWAVVHGEDRLIISEVPHAIADRLGKRLQELGLLLDGWRVEER